MKLTLRKQYGSRGNTLFIVLFTTLVIGVVLATYLTLVSQQNLLSARSQAFNTTIPIVEAGIEEALSHLNENGVTNVLVPQDPPPYLFANGWQNESNYAVMRRPIGDGRYVVSISTNGATPVIDSMAYVTTPLNITSAGNPMFGAAQVNTGPSEVRRTVRVTTQINPIFQYALVVKDGINANGNSCTVDAFDSADPLYSTNSQYLASKATDGGGVATLSTNANALSFGTIHVYGSLATAPGGSISTNSWYVGTHAWQTANPSTHIEPGYFTKDFNAGFPDVKAPFNTGLMPLAGTVNGTLYSYVLGDGNYYMSAGVLQGKVIVTGKAVLYVTSTAMVNFLAGGSITISTNGQLRLYVGSASATLPNVVNDNGTADKFVYLGLPTNTSISQTVNADFIGSIYAPEADYTLGGNGSGLEQMIIGGSIVKSMHYNDFFTFHYDKNLARVGLDRGYIVKTWNEIDSTTAHAQ